MNTSQLPHLGHLLADSLEAVTRETTSSGRRGALQTCLALLRQVQKELAVELSQEALGLPTVQDPLPVTVTADAVVGQAIAATNRPKPAPKPRKRSK